MRKRLFFVAIAICLACAAWGQKHGQKSSFQLGLRTGVSLSDMRYSFSEYDVYHHWPNVLGAGRLFAEYRKGTGFGFRLEGGITQRGTHLRWADVDYRLAASYADARLLLVCCMSNQSSFTPYLAAGGTASAVMGGKIKYESCCFDPAAVPLNNYNINSTDFGFYGAVGFEYRLRNRHSVIPLALEVGYGRGLRDTYSPHETAEESVIVNDEVDVRPTQGTRFNQGVEVTLSASIQLRTNSNRSVYRQRRRIQSRRCVY